MNAHPEVVSMGHAIVDVLVPTDDSLIASLGLERGTMHLVDDEQAERIYAALGSGTEISGGSAANTAACLASFGASAEFVGKVREDQLGQVFRHDIKAAGVSYCVPPAHEGPPTGRCLVMVSPDGERTMCTNLGAAALLGPSDVPPADVSAARALYIEGYLCHPGPTAEAVEEAVAIARRSATLVALSLSDPSWVELQGDSLRRLLDRVDLLFSNEDEALLLSGQAEVDRAVNELRSSVDTVVVTRGARGALVSSEGATIEVAAEPVARVVDTTGAGDSFAAGYLYGLVRALGAEASARIGAVAAAEIISHMGARPQASLSALAAQAGLVPA
jgi:sugar/nucleoside kinase (ribokinase family)